jgi:purine-binding chemotaxis protein CheW
MNELYVVFTVASTEYALPASLVRQLESYQGSTHVPGSAAHVAGIIQVRGQVVPVIELRRLFGHQSVEPTLDTRVIVTELGERKVGLIVDKSREVLSIDTAKVQAAPILGEARSRGLLNGVVQQGQRLIVLIDLAKVVGEEQLDVEFSKRLESGFRDRPELPAGPAFVLADGGSGARQGD